MKKDNRISKNFSDIETFKSESLQVKKIWWRGHPPSRVYILVVVGVTGRVHGWESSHGLCSVFAYCIGGGTCEGNREGKAFLVKLTESRWKSSSQDHVSHSIFFHCGESTQLSAHRSYRLCILVNLPLWFSFESSINKVRASFKKIKEPVCEAALM